MKFSLRNLGRLQEATIDLGKDLIVLTGPNNTSKTYVAHAIYGFYRTFFVNSSMIALEYIKKHFSTERAETIPRISIDLFALLSQYAQSITTDVNKFYQGQLADIFASSKNFVATTEIAFEHNKEWLEKQKQRLLESSDTITNSTYTTTQKAIGSHIWTFEQRSAPSTQAPPATFDFVGTVCTILAFEIAFSLIDRPATHILAAERAAIQLFSKELSLNRTTLVDSLLQIKNSADQKANAGGVLFEALEQRAKRYPLAIRESLLVANDLATLKKESSHFANLADRLEQELLGGSIRIDESGEMLFQPAGPGPGLNLHLSSSSVKSLSGLSFFLRHIAAKNHFLIIDEPELNLHPDNQRRVARLLARIVRAGIKVLISTHSDYVIRELNNCIMLSGDKDGSVRKRLGYDEEETLSPEQVGAYLFDATRARPIEVQPTGIEVETIDREINSLNAVSQDIYFSLFNKSDT